MGKTVEISKKRVYELSDKISDGLFDWISTFRQSEEGQKTPDSCLIIGIADFASKVMYILGEEYKEAEKPVFQAFVEMFLLKYRHIAFG